MKRWNWFLLLGVSFLILSAMTYTIHYFIFQDTYFIGKYLVAQLGFLPINVFLVTIVLNSLLGNREKRMRMQKLNMVIGAFFSDVGTDLLSILSKIEAESPSSHKDLDIQANWKDADFALAKDQLRKTPISLQPEINDLIILHLFLKEKRVHLLRLLENTNLLEHESFSKLLWAIFHLAEELQHRQNIEQLRHSDMVHLGADAKRTYLLLLQQWIDYMKHLKQHYPHLFSLAVRTNPFNPNAQVEVIE